MKLLVMDDSLAIRKRVVELVESVRGVSTIFESENPGEAMRVMREYAPEIAILDIQVPAANNMRSGIDVLRAVKKDFSGTGIIMLTNFANPIFEAECKRLGADYFLDKSWEFEKVPDAVEALMKVKNP
jgi:DNA-binding NarL/FixJ family response regulator